MEDILITAFVLINITWFICYTHMLHLHNQSERDMQSYRNMFQLEINLLNKKLQSIYGNGIHP
jgi:hypothetical protein